jgi:hypothetical protein
MKKLKTKIGIPKPCPENWDDMNPTEKGAFCTKCAFEVIDFTDKSPEDIRTVLTNRSGLTTCGHIKTSQLEMVNSNYHLWNSQSSKTFKSKFLYACLMVFGMGLFSGCNTSSDSIQNEEDTDETIRMGMVEVDTTYDYPEDTIVEGEIEEWEEEDN